MTAPEHIYGTAQHGIHQAHIKPHQAHDNTGTAQNTWAASNAGVYCGVLCCGGVLVPPKSCVCVAMAVCITWFELNVMARRAVGRCADAEREAEEEDDTDTDEADSADSI